MIKPIEVIFFFLQDSFHFLFVQTLLIQNLNQIKILLNLQTMSQKHNPDSSAQLISISREISNLLQSRKKTVDKIITQTSNVKPQLSQSYNRQIITHCSQYSSIKKFVHEMTRNQNFLKSISEQSAGFWETNEKIQRDLEKRLKNLKEIDMKIQAMVQLEIEMAKQIQEIEQSIRGILSRKQQDHIMKAEPLYIKKQSYITKLQEMKKQKEQIKQQKLVQLIKILQILEQMKKLRKKRLDECRQSSFGKESMTLFECLAKDIEQLVENKKLGSVHQNNQKKMMLLLNQTNEKIQRLSRQLAQTFETQQKAFQQITKICRTRAQNNLFHQRLCGYFQTSQQQIFSISERFARFIEVQNLKSTELNQVLQGINTTQDTIQIFDNLKHNIETETLRKRQLVDKINKLNKIYAVEKERRQVISQKQSRIQAMKINFSKYQTLLQEAAEQADVKEYKVIHSQLDDLSRSIKTQHQDLEKLKSLKRQSAKRIYHETNSIQEEYRDLISEMFPQIWLRDNDFTRDQTISDFQVYLGKLFSRLKILA